MAEARLAAPQIPFVSSMTGTWITDDQATDPRYWARHLREAVQFSAGVTELLKKPNAALIEAGPGNVLSTLARQHLKSRNGAATDTMIACSLPRDSSGRDNATDILNGLGSLWQSGAEPIWQAVHSGERRLRIPLPTYPFERKRYWFEPSASKAQSAVVSHPSQVPVPSPTRITNSEENPIVDTTVNPTLSTPPEATPKGELDRAAKIRTMLGEIFEDLSGVQISSADEGATFLEMGFDSLFLTQVTQAVQSKFNVKTTFRQLLGEQSSVKSLAEYINERLSGDFFGEPVNAAPVASAQSVAESARDSFQETQEDFGEVLRHELNNPLTGILGNAELLLAEIHRNRDGKLPHGGEQRLETIAALAVRLRETVRRLSEEWETRQHPVHVAEEERGK